MIINPLKVWVQNILPVVYDDSLSYLEVVAKINAKTNEIITQTNENTHAIETLAEVIAELGDIDELKALLEEIEAIINDLYTADLPLMNGTASAGSANHAARSDHVHPVDERMYTFPKPNLIINPFWIKSGGFPVNQRGLTSYLNNGPTIDMWTANQCTLEVSNDGLIITGNVNRNGLLVQELKHKEALIGKTLTLSLIINNKLISATGTIPTDLPASITTFFGTDVESGVACYVRGSTNGIYIYIWAASSYEPLTPFTLTAIKLELGSIQTLATIVNDAPVINEIPNYSEELIKCQRYFQIFSSDSMRPTYGVDCRPVMSANEPTKGTITIGPTTYYTLEE